MSTDSHASERVEHDPPAAPDFLATRFWIGVGLFFLTLAPFAGGVSSLGIAVSGLGSVNTGLSYWHLVYHTERKSGLSLAQRLLLLMLLGTVVVFVSVVERDVLEWVLWFFVGALAPLTVLRFWAVVTKRWDLRLFGLSLF